jgi:ribulose-phosphate 3-epimerase
MNFDLPVLAPSILAADYTRLGQDINECLKGDVRWIHCDIMDGHFVPNISFGPDVVAAVRRAAPEAFLDVHLMIENPDNYVESFADAGADLISVHYEACPHLHRTLQNIRYHGCMNGVVINPGTSVELIEPVLNYTDLVLIMSVNPGLGGQSLIDESYDKISRLRATRSEHKSEFLIEVDGGVNLKNIRKLVETGVDVLVAGSSVFKADDITNRVQELKAKANLGRKDFV